MKLYIYAFLTMLVFCNISCKEGGSSGSEYEIKSSEITWLNLEQAEGLGNGEKKMYFLDLYTSWCGWCKVMDRETFTNAEIIKYMNENFHNVKFDAEQKEQATFDGKQYDWMAGGRNGVNQLAVELLQGDLSYPSYVVLDENKKLVKTFKGFMEAESFLQVIKSVVP